MKLKIAATLEIREPTKEFELWLKDNLVVTNPEYTKKVRMGFYVGNTPRTIKLYSEHYDHYEVPYGCLKLILPFFKKKDISNYITPTRSPVDFGDPIPLYDYQEDAVNGMIKATYGILQAPAGSGKTQMGLAIAQRLQMKVLWLTHTKDLLNQSKERAERYFPKNEIGTITEGKIACGHSITFATIQTMCNVDFILYRNDFDVVIVDECHRVAGSPTSLTMFSKVLNNITAKHKYGLSATVHRADGMIKATYTMLGNIAYTVPEEAVKERVMSVAIKPIGTGVPIDPHKCLNTDGTIKYTGLISYLANDEYRNDLIGSYIIANRGHSILVLSSRLSQLTELRESLPDELYSLSAMIDGKMTSKKKKEERENALEQMRTGEKQILFATYSLAKEGLDIPRLDRLFLASPEKDYAVITQSIGRIARTFPGKEQPICYDFVDAFQIANVMFKRRMTTYKKNNCEVLTIG